MRHKAAAARGGAGGADSESRRRPSRRGVPREGLGAATDQLLGAADLGKLRPSPRWDGSYPVTACPSTIIAYTYKSPLEDFGKLP